MDTHNIQPGESLSKEEKPITPQAQETIVRKLIAAGATTAAALGGSALLAFNLLQHVLETASYHLPILFK